VTTRIAIFLLVTCLATPIPLSAQATDCKEPHASPEAIRRSKEEHLFSGQKGAAWFKTDQGMFEVWFLADPAAAAAVVAKVTAHPPPINLPSGPSEFFTQHQNVVFHVSMGQKALAVSSQTAFQKP
jgi:hypothetical protein